MAFKILLNKFNYSAKYFEKIVKEREREREGERDGNNFLIL